MSEPTANEEEIAELKALEGQPFGKKISYFAKKSGPGWLQGAITLGGGSLAGAMYLGVIMGYNMMWLQPLAMILGVIMLSAIAYVTLTTRERPFGAINQHVSPVLGWAWLIAALMANIVWCMPQFNLGRAAIQQNLIPAVGDGTGATIGICVVLFLVAAIVNYFYDSGGKGIKIFEIILKAMVGVVVISFFFVVVVLTTKGQLEWGKIFAGFIPDFSLLTQPAPAFREMVAQSSMAEFWTEKISSDQKDKMITAFGTAVGINMTFLLPYSMLRKGWRGEHRSLAIFDLSIGLIVPFVLATGCVLIASASQFHGKYSDVLNEDGTVVASMAGAYNKVIDARVAEDETLGADFKALQDELKDLGKEISEQDKKRIGDAMNEMRAQMPGTDKKVAAMLANRDNFNLANALRPLTGDFFAQVVFGIGVLGMALSTIIILMLINGFVFCELFNKPGNRNVHFLGAIVAGLGGIAGPFIWGNSDAKAALAIPTSVIGGAMIPIAYFTFLLLMNSKSLLGDAKPTGGRAIKWNVLMILATGIATGGTVWVLLGKGKPGMIGIIVLVILFILGLIGFLKNEKKAQKG